MLASWYGCWICQTNAQSLPNQLVEELQSQHTGQTCPQDSEISHYRGRSPEDVQTSMGLLPSVAVRLDLLLDAIHVNELASLQAGTSIICASHVGDGWKLPGTLGEQETARPQSFLSLLVPFLRTELLVSVLLTCQLVNGKLTCFEDSTPMCQRSISVANHSKFVNQTLRWLGPRVPLLKAFHQTKLFGYGIIVPNFFKSVSAWVVQNVWIIYPLILTIRWILFQAPKMEIIAYRNHDHPQDNIDQTYDNLIMHINSCWPWPEVSFHYMIRWSDLGMNMKCMSPLHHEYLFMIMMTHDNILAK